MLCFFLLQPFYISRSRVGVETGQKSKAEFLTTTQFDLEAALTMSVQSQRERSQQKIAYQLTPFSGKIPNISAHLGNWEELT